MRQLSFAFCSALLVTGLEVRAARAEDTDLLAILGQQRIAPLDLDAALAGLHAGRPADEERLDSRSAGATSTLGIGAIRPGGGAAPRAVGLQGAERVLAHADRAVAACYEPLVGSEVAEDRLAAAFEVAPSGAVTNVRISLWTRGGVSRTETCAIAALRTLVFPADSARGAVTVERTWRFSFAERTALVL